MQDTEPNQVREATRVFENHPKLRRKTNNPESLDEIVSNWESRGTTLVYEVRNTKGELQLEASPIRVEEENELIGGSVSFVGLASGDFIKKHQQKIAKKHCTSYVVPSDGFPDLAKFQIPVDFDYNKFERAVEHSIDMIEDAERLQDYIRNAIDDFERHLDNRNQPASSLKVLSDD